MAGIARDILAAAPARFALAGLSMGVSIALELVRQAPARVTRLALLDGRAALDDDETMANRRSYIKMARTGRFTEITRDHLLPRLIHPKRRADRALVQTILDMAEATGPEIFIRQETAILERADYRPFLPEIRCPTLVLVGADDAITPPPMAAEMAQAIAGARLEIVADCGHLSTLERPAETSALLESWLRASASQ
jgi:pimeloyl-ACP methyl ester carboxylesterase